MPIKNESDCVIGILGIYQGIDTNITYDENNAESIDLTLLPEVKTFAILKNATNASLTHREIECLSLWLSGQSIKASADCLEISQKCIEAYRKQIKDKIGIDHKNQLINFVEEKGVFHLFLTLSKLIEKKPI